MKILLIDMKTIKRYVKRERTIFIIHTAKRQRKKMILCFYVPFHNLSIGPLQNISQLFFLSYKSHIYPSKILQFYTSTHSHSKECILPLSTKILSLLQFLEYFNLGFLKFIAKVKLVNSILMKYSLQFSRAYLDRKVIKIVLFLLYFK